MDFSGLANNLSGQISRQLAEQLLSNPILRDAAVKSNQEEENETNPSAPTAPPSGLDNLLNQLSAALTRAVNAPDVPSATSGAPAASADDLNLLNNPVVQQLLDQLDLQTALSLKVLLGGMGSEAAKSVADFVRELPSSTMNKVACCLKTMAPEDITKAVDLFKLMFQNNKDAIFHQRGNADVYYNSANKVDLTPADLDAFLRTAYQVTRRGGDLGDFMDASAEVLQKGDYDDFRRFLEVADTVMYKGESLSTYYNFSSQVLNANAKSYEGNIFEAYVVMAHGGGLQDYIDIANNLGTTTDAGRNQMVNLTTVITDFRKQGGYPPALIQQMVNEAKSGGSVEQFISDYMDYRGFTKAGPDYSRFDVIGRMDGEVMEITQGDNAALFAQAISSVDGLLPESVLYWSSKETGALDHGTSYLDLSNLAAGTYQIAVKIGGYGYGTDTAIKTVVVKDADGNVPDNAGGVIVHGDRGHGNDADGVDEQNPGNSNGINPNQGNGHNGAEDDGDVPGATQGSSSAEEFLRNNLPVGGGSANAGQAQATQSSGASEESDEVGAVSDQPAVSDVEASDGENQSGTSDVEAVAPALPPLTKEEATQVSKDALALAQAKSELEAIRNLLNERYYAALDAQVAFNQDYTRQLQEYMTDRTGAADTQLTTLLGKILGELTGTDPVAQQQQQAQQTAYRNPYGSAYRNPYG